MYFTVLADMLKKGFQIVFDILKKLENLEMKVSVNFSKPDSSEKMFI